MNTFFDAVRDANLRGLRKQNAELLAENDKLKRQLAAWPVRALEHALAIRETVSRESLDSFRAQRNHDMGDAVREALNIR